MALTNMKMDPKAREEQCAPSTIACDQPVYPWGLSISLNKESLEALGITKLPDVGETLLLSARVTVSSCSETAAQDDSGKSRKDRTLGLQITDMELEADDDAKPATSVLYDEGKK